MNLLLFVWPPPLLLFVHHTGYPPHNTMVAAVSITENDNATQPITTITAPFPEQFGSYNPSYLTVEEADALKSFCDGCNFHEYTFARTGKPLKRAPKCEFTLDDTVGVYRWGQSRAEYDNARPMPDLLRTLAARLNGNHCIVIRYTHGTEHFAPGPRTDDTRGVVLYSSSVRATSTATNRRERAERAQPI